MKNGLSHGLSIGVIALLLGCAEGFKKPIVDHIESQKVGARTSVGPTAQTVMAHTYRVTINKDAILGRQFFYGADLQYSSLFDKDYDLYLQSLAVGHIPAHFVIAENELRLMADLRHYFPSDVNHPERLIARFVIHSMTDTQLTVSAMNASLFLSQLFEAAKKDGGGVLIDSTADTPRDSWVRSFSYDNSDRLILQQTSVQLADGTVAEFMESIMPREALEPGKDFVSIPMDPDHPAGAEEGLAQRYRFLNGESIFKGEQKLSFASHYDLSNGKTIDWYVTPNIPDHFLNAVEETVHAWNRYYRNFKGIQRDVLKFKGRLGEGQFLGDPRLNVINWDSRTVAGAAYESQASDPFTGRQSHSLIYMPAAWFQMGYDYWEKGQYSGGRKKFLEIQRRVSCMRDLKGIPAYLYSGRFLDTDPAAKDFGIRLMKTTLLHEIGHSLGLAHNFKGSLSWDRSKPESPTTHSIMDYNDYELELSVFPKTNDTMGPELEYDRQALSALYNRMSDVSKEDEELQACNDQEADAEEDGVDPLCIRYDAEHDPTRAIESAFDRIQRAQLDGDVTLSQAYAHVAALMMSAERSQNIVDNEKLRSFVTEFSKRMRAATHFYFISGKMSLGASVRQNLKSLLVFQEDIIPEGLNERLMRERAFEGVQRVLSMRALPESMEVSITSVASMLGLYMKKTPYMQRLAPSEVENQLKESLALWNKTVRAFATDTKSGLPKLRSQVLGSLSRAEKVSYFFGSAEGARFDFETAVLDILSTSLESTQLFVERLAAAEALRTFSGRLIADQMISDTVRRLKGEFTLARNNQEREQIQELVAILTRQDSKE